MSATATFDRDPALAKAWRAHAQETPPAHLDRAILAAAHRAVGSAPQDAARAARAESTQPQRWWMPLAAAAAIGVVAIGIVQTVPEETLVEPRQKIAPVPAAAPQVATQDLAQGVTESAKEAETETAAAPQVATEAKTQGTVQRATGSAKKAETKTAPEPARNVAPSVPSADAPASTRNVAPSPARSDTQEASRDRAAAEASRDNAASAMRKSVPPPQAPAPAVSAPSVSAMAPAVPAEAPASAKVTQPLAQRAPSVVGSAGMAAPVPDPFPARAAEQNAETFAITPSAAPPPVRAESLRRQAVQAPQAFAPTPSGGATNDAAALRAPALAPAPAPAPPAAAAAPPPLRTMRDAASAERTGAAAMGRLTGDADQEARAKARDPDAWLLRIRKLHDAGDLETAARELREFRRAVPDAQARIPRDLRAWAATVE